MRLKRVTVADYRSIWGPSLELPLDTAVTAIVGPNLAGKSNLLRATAAALTADHPVAIASDRPRSRPEAVPRVELRFADRRHGRPDHVDVTVSWPVGRRVVDVRPGGDHDRPGATPVLAWIGETPREVLLRHRGDLAGSWTEVADDLLPTLQRVIPEIAAVHIDADTCDVTVTDVSGYEVAPITLRACFAAAVAAHLVRAGVDVPAVLVEEPESYLHPAAQESLGDELLEVGVAADAPVLLTTESPFMLPRHRDSRVVAVARDDHGRTRIVGSALGDEPQAPLLGGLFRDTGLAAVLDRTASIPAGTAGVLVVEGGTDEAYLRIAASTLGRADVLERVVIQQAGGAAPAALQAIVLRAETDVALYVLLDNDDAGRRAKKTLVDRFGFDNRRQVASYAEVVPDHPLGTEAEDLFDWRLVERFVKERGDSSIRGKRILRGDEWHFDLTSSSKSAFVGWLREHVRQEHLERWGLLLDLLEERLEL